jgi:hypothetical protein
MRQEEFEASLGYIGDAGSKKTKRKKRKREGNDNR